MDAIDLQIIRSARVSIEARHREREEHNRDLHAQACRDAAKIIRYIASNYRPTRLFQWGSLLDVSHFREYSDIDIALEGILMPADFFQILKDAQRLTTFPVDIVQLETIEPEFASSIREYGKLVYERT